MSCIHLSFFYNKIPYCEVLNCIGSADKCAFCPEYKERQGKVSVEVVYMALDKNTPILTEKFEMPSIPLAEERIRNDLEQYMKPRLQKTEYGIKALFLTEIRILDDIGFPIKIPFSL